MTAGGDGYRLAICNGSLSSSDNMLQPRLNEGSVITVTACCAWQPAFLPRCCGFRARGSQLQVFFLESVKKTAGEEVESSRFFLQRLLKLEVLEVTEKSPVNKTNSVALLFVSWIVLQGGCDRGRDFDGFARACSQRILLPRRGVGRGSATARAAIVRENAPASVSAL